MTKSKKEIEALKKEWEIDPCWDIEDTEGFEEHREELLGFRKALEAKQVRKRVEEAKVLAREWGLSGNYEFGERMLELLQRVSRIEEAIELQAVHIGRRR